MLHVLPRLLPLSLLVSFAACSSDTADSGSEPTPDAEGSSEDAAAPDVEADAGSGSDATDDAGAEPDVTVEPRVIPVFDNIRISSSGAEGEFNQRAKAPVDWGAGPFASVILHVELETTCFPFEDWSTPPPGHNWPADCDAFDRNFEFTLDEPTAEGDPPAWELVRAITPFGGPMTFDVDITDLANFLPGAHDIDVYIATWNDSAGQVSGSNGGWFVSAELRVVDGPAPREVLTMVPLFNGNYGETTEVGAIPFTVPEGTVEGVLEYRTTGHGGGDGGRACIGPAEEFCQRTHSVDLDGETVWFFEPWRDDCDTLCTLQNNGQFEYCAENPCGSIGSVRAPRANWCPGDVTPPLIIEDPALVTPGEHTFEFFVPGVAPGGSWRTSVRYVAYGDEP